MSETKTPKTCFGCKPHYFAYMCFHPEIKNEDGHARIIDCEYTTTGGNEPHPFDGFPSWCPLIKKVV